MKNATFWQRLRYRFDNLMSKGTPSLLLILGVITAIVVVIGGFDENVTSLVEELAYATENRQDAVVVIMADHDNDRYGRHDP